jgi:hypothetical protein
MSFSRPVSDGIGSWFDSKSEVDSLKCWQSRRENIDELNSDNEDNNNAMTLSELPQAKRSRLTSAAASVTDLQIYDQIQTTRQLDLISASLKVRQFIEAVIHVRLSLQAAQESTPKRPYNNKLRNSKLIGSKIQVNIFVSDVHAALYQSVMTWVLALSPSVEPYVVCSVEVGAVMLSVCRAECVSC